MDSTGPARWDVDRMHAWAAKWLAKYAKCTAAGEHVKGCACKSGPPLGVLMWVCKEKS